MTKLSVIRASPNVIDGSTAGDLTLSCDVCIVGTGAGGAVTAADPRGSRPRRVDDRRRRLLHVERLHDARERRDPASLSRRRDAHDEGSRDFDPSRQSRRRHDGRELDDELSHARRRRRHLARQARREGLRVRRSRSALRGDREATRRSRRSPRIRSTRTTASSSKDARRSDGKPRRCAATSTSACRPVFAASGVRSTRSARCS